MRGPTWALTTRWVPIWASALAIPNRQGKLAGRSAELAAQKRNAQSKAAEIQSCDRAR